ncbi:DUF4845 domain-containing protein [Teredinibacter franksiae]|uniref:DUF4845 domain-containing protein n=1 Tax=Teredinibacter franksiae TaxID=2761453 RepID=UPI00162370BF|nr:DUF4845 domain-containing protein [Teredinibacter franksiae]
MKSIKSQAGLGSITWLVILMVAGFFLLCFFRLGPHYLDNISIDAALKSLAEQEENLGSMDKRDIYRKLDNFMMVNNVRGPEAESFKVIRKKDRVLVNNEYEKRIHMFLNIDVLLTFKSQLDTSNPELCCEYLIEPE